MLAITGTDLYVAIPKLNMPFTLQTTLTQSKQQLHQLNPKTFQTKLNITRYTTPHKENLDHCQIRPYNPTLHLFQIGFSQLQNEFRFFRLSSAIYKLSSTVGEFTLG